MYFLHLHFHILYNTILLYNIITVIQYYYVHVRVDVKKDVQTKN